MSNGDNLKSLADRTTEEQRAIARMGGIKSGKVRRERKKLKDELLLLLSEGNIQAEMCLAIIKQATEGNTKAFEIIRDTIGERPVENISVENNAQINELKAVFEGVKNGE